MYVLLLVTLLLIIFSILPFFLLLKREINITDNTIYSCRTYDGGQIMRKIYNKLGLEKISNKEAKIYLPCGYTGVERELSQLQPAQGQIILAIDGCDNIVSKNGLWKTLSEMYGREGASELTPRSYRLNIKTDMEIFDKEFRPDQIYILKKNIQRQLGLKISRNYNEIKQANKEGYIIIQEYIMNPLLIDRRKFDMRIYLLIVQRNGHKYFYRHSEGRCHYTSQDYTTALLDKGIHIPSGYTEDKDFKQTHPETLAEVRIYLDSWGNNAGQILFSNIDKMLTKCCRAFVKVLGANTKYSDTIRCQLFGIDILSNNNLIPFLIEINKGPEMSWSSQQEYEYKMRVTEDMFALLDLSNAHNSNGYKLLLIA